MPERSPGSRRREVAGIVLIAAGLVLGVYALSIPATAYIKGVLIERAWSVASRYGDIPRPWPWAKVRPVARLSFPRIDTSMLVLGGLRGRTMRLEPAHIDGTAEPGQPGHSVVAVHRDAHFIILRYARIGDIINVERPGGAYAVFVVVDRNRIDVRNRKIILEPIGNHLSLIARDPTGEESSIRYVLTAAAM